MGSEQFPVIEEKIREMTSAALQNHQSGQLVAAERLYRRILVLNPSHAEILHLFGILACQVRRHGVGITLILKAISCEKENWRFYGNLAVALRNHGRADKAAVIWRNMILTMPEVSDGYFNIGSIMSERKTFDKSLVNGRRAIILNENLAPAHYNYGVTLYALEQANAAILSWLKTLCLMPDHREACTNLGVALQKQELMEEAHLLYCRSIRIDQNYVEAHYNLGKAFHEQGNPAEAVRSWRKAIILKPDHFQAYSNQGGLLGDLQRPNEGELAYHRALTIDATFVEAYSSLAVALHGQERRDEAIFFYQKALVIKPDFMDANYNQAMTLLANGDYKRGWRFYEWRWKTPLMLPGWRDFGVPQWYGEEGRGRRLFIHGEQGFGDILQFCRYAPLAASVGWKVILEVRPPLARLMKSLENIYQFVLRGTALPAFDAHCPMLSLPLAFCTNVGTIPSSFPYLKAEEGLVDFWRNYLNDNFSGAPRIGLVWAGSPAHLSPCDRRRSIAPEMLAPLLNRQDMFFFSLQKGGSKAPKEFALIDFMEDMEDFADTAALIANLDLVISVDTSVAHLAGALGKKVWLLDRYDACWRWLRGREDSPWYPGMRIFRQGKSGDWHGVIDRVKRELDSFVLGRDRG